MKARLTVIRTCEYNAELCLRATQLGSAKIFLVFRFIKCKIKQLGAFFYFHPTFLLLLYDYVLATACCNVEEISNMGKLPSMVLGCLGQSQPWWRFWILFFIRAPFTYCVFQ
jgi:hypothetical protein